MEEELKKAKKKRDPMKSQIIRNLFDIEDKPSEPLEKTKSVIIIKYNETVFFKNKDNKSNEEIQKYISNVLQSNGHSVKNSKTNQNIQFNVNINNNYYNSIKADQKIPEPDTLANKVKLSPVNRNTFQRENSKVSTSSSSNQILRKKSSHDDNSNVLLYIPCMNCGNSIAIDDIEKHSMSCTKVSDEVLKNESNSYELYNINYKLNKLKEHVSLIKNGTVNVPTGIEKEMMYISTVLLQYINDTMVIEVINVKSIQDLKKLLKNLDTLSLTYKSSMSSMILIERTKILIKEKLKIYIASYKNKIETDKLNERKTGCIYEDAVKEKAKELEKIRLETELAKTKVKNLRKSATPLNKPKNLNIIVNESYPETEKIVNNNKNEESNINDLSGLVEDNNYNAHMNNKVDEIVSDVENISLNNVSMNTSMSNMSFTGKDDEMEMRNTIGSRGSTGFKPIQIDSPSNTAPNLSSNTQKEIEFNYGTFSNNPMDPEFKKKKQLFFNAVLKIKLEKLHSTHKGMQIPPKLIFFESQRLRIPEEKWQEFILGELNNPIKYMNMKKKKINTIREPTMSIIAEEK